MPLGNSNKWLLLCGTWEWKPNVEAGDRRGYPDKEGARSGEGGGARAEGGVKEAAACCVRDTDTRQKVRSSTRSTEDHVFG